MFFKSRRNLFAIFAIFFVIITPFLIIYSLGFDLNLKDNELSNTLSITIETLPRGANIFNRNNKIGSSPTELKAKDGQLIPISIKYAGFIEEDFTLRGQDNLNSTTRITGLTLIPKNGDIISKFDYRPLALLSNDLILFSDGNKLYTQLYGFAGLQGKKDVVERNSQRIIEQGYWQVLSNNSFWYPEENFLLYKNQEGWHLVDLEIYPETFVSIVNIDENNFLLQANDGQLWTMSTSNKDLNYIDSGVMGLSATDTPDNIWIWKQNTVYKLPRQQINTENYNIESNIFSNIPFIFNEDKEDLKIRNFQTTSVFQGIVFKFGDSLYYIPDFNKHVWQFLTDDVLTFTADGNNVFWIDSSGRIFTYNYLFKERIYLGSLDNINKTSDFKLYYYYTWKRLFVYNSEQVFTVWFDKDIENNTINKYFPKQWLEDVSCLPKVVDKFQFCLQDKNLMSWKNTAIW